MCVGVCHIEPKKPGIPISLSDVARFEQSQQFGKLILLSQYPKLAPHRIYCSLSLGSRPKEGVVGSHVCERERERDDDQVGGRRIHHVGPDVVVFFSGVGITLIS